MIVVYDVGVNKTLDNRHRVAWSAKKSLSNFSESVDDYNFQIFWSFDPVTDFNPIKDESGNVVIIDGAIGPLYVEHYVKHTPFSREHYYKVRAVNKVTPGNYKDSSIVYEGDRSDGVLKTISHSEWMLNRNYIGEPIYLKKRKTDGSRCPECWNQYTYQRTKTHCMTCKNTGFFDGYYKAIEVQVSFERNPKLVEVGVTGEVQTSTIRARMSHFPLVTPRDLIVSKDNNTRFTITRVDYTKLPNLANMRGSLSSDAYIVSQMLTLAEIAPDDDRYNVIVSGRDIKSIYGASDIRVPQRIDFIRDQMILPRTICSGTGDKPIRKIRQDFSDCLLQHIMIDGYGRIIPAPRDSELVQNDFIIEGSGRIPPTSSESEIAMQGEFSIDGIGESDA